ncbi:MAG: COG3014 family protein [Methylococcaceae bacterium]
MTGWVKRLFLIFVLVYLVGCSTFRSYNKEMGKTLDLTTKGQVDMALQEHEKHNTGSDKDLLYFFEKGELLRLNGQYQDSVDTWLEADKKVEQWENEAKITAGKIARGAGSLLLNDKTRRYDGHDYEKVMVSTRLALDHILLGDWEKARTEIKKTHEREAVIAELRAREAEKVEEEAKSNNITTTFKDLKGYPVMTLDDPEVIGLKNGYQSAFSHYLAGFVYEALGEPGLAAPGYRQAIELRPDIKQLEDALAGLDVRTGPVALSGTDVLFVVESSLAPALESITIPIPMPVGGVGIVPISFPLIHSDPTPVSVRHVSLDDDKTLNLDVITNVDAMARRALRDDMPGIITRGLIRSAAKAATQAAVNKQNGIAGLALTLFNLATESADERSWRILPATISIGRMLLPSGIHQLHLETSTGTQSLPVNIKGRYAVVPVRILSNKTYLSQAAFQDKSPVMQIATTQVQSESVIPASEPPEKIAKTTKATKAKSGSRSKSR